MWVLIMMAVMPLGSHCGDTWKNPCSVSTLIDTYMTEADCKAAKVQCAPGPQPEKNGVRVSAICEPWEQWHNRKHQ